MDILEMAIIMLGAKIIDSIGLTGINLSKIGNFFDLSLYSGDEFLLV